MVPRVYVDTSVVGGCLDEEFREHSNRLLADFESGLLRAVLSNITIAELKQAPDGVRSLLDPPGRSVVNKTFDAVRMMREIRDRMSREISRMTPEEQIEYFEKKSGLHEKREGIEEAAQPSPEP
ncbi:MAG: hypothetical protein JXR96_25850 [Deltaproteobacteria bacterium]|nr:hypothetical protein [Deltaproteobacteria bacterium]